MASLLSCYFQINLAYFSCPAAFLFTFLLAYLFACFLFACKIFLNLLSDTLLNVFLAIAVDNLANAQALTRDEEIEMRKREEAKQIRRKKLLLNEDKWSRVRAVPKILAIRKKSDVNDNPFSGMTFQRREGAADK